jgi:hypothetical protein
MSKCFHREGFGEGLVLPHPCVPSHANIIRNRWINSGGENILHNPLFAINISLLAEWFYIYLFVISHGGVCKSLKTRDDEVMHLKRKRRGKQKGPSSLHTSG